MFSKIRFTNIYLRLFLALLNILYSIWWLSGIIPSGERSMMYRILESDHVNLNITILVIFFVVSNIFFFMNLKKVRRL